MPWQEMSAMSLGEEFTGLAIRAGATIRGVVPAVRSPSCDGLQVAGTCARRGVPGGPLASSQAVAPTLRAGSGVARTATASGASGVGSAQAGAAA